MIIDRMNLIVACNAWVNSRSDHSPPPPPEHTREFDLICYDSANARMPHPRDDFKCWLNF
jgi:hypothetical protein